jgi:hypothetical protein
MYVVYPKENYLITDNKQEYDISENKAAKLMTMRYIIRQLKPLTNLRLKIVG